MNKKDNKQEQDIPLSFTQLEGVCYCCGKKDHKSPDCHNKDKIPQEEWAINKSKVSHVQLQASENASMNTETGTRSQAQSQANNNNQGWAGVQHGFYQTSVM